jgi:two-component system cell cycle response regulator
MEMEKMSETKGHILVVDDHSTNRLKLSLAVKKIGLTVSTAEDGQDALRKLRAEQFDLVLLDILMPELDGYAVLEIMKDDEVLRSIPVIVISSVDEMASVVKAIELGAEDYLPKTFDPVLLEARVGACLEKKRLHDQEIEYLRQVEYLTDAAAVVEKGDFEPDTLQLEEVVSRADALGRLARVFENMVRTIFEREQNLKQQVKDLRIEFDKAHQADEVQNITGTDYFKRLRSRAGRLRKRLEDDATD